MAEEEKLKFWGKEAVDSSGRPLYDASIFSDEKFTEDEFRNNDSVLKAAALAYDMKHHSGAWAEKVVSNHWDAKTARSQLADEAISTMRWFNNNIANTLLTTGQMMAKGTDEQKMGFLYLMDAFEHKKNNYLGGSVDFLIQGVVTDPTTWLSFVSGGAAKVGGLAAKKAALLGFREAVTAVARKGMTRIAENTVADLAKTRMMKIGEKQLVKTIVKIGGKDVEHIVTVGSLSRAAVKGAIPGAINNAITDGITQGISLQKLTIDGQTYQRQKGWSWSEFGFGVGSGAVMGAGFGVTGHMTSPYLKKAAVSAGQNFKKVMGNREGFFRLGRSSGSATGGAGAPTPAAPTPAAPAAGGPAVRASAKATAAKFALKAISKIPVINKFWYFPEYIKMGLSRNHFYNNYLREWFAVIDTRKTTNVVNYFLGIDPDLVLKDAKLNGRRGSNGNFIYVDPATGKAVHNLRGSVEELGTALGAPTSQAYTEALEKLQADIAHTKKNIGHIEADPYDMSVSKTGKVTYSRKKGLTGGTIVARLAVYETRAQIAVIDDFAQKAANGTATAHDHAAAMQALNEIRNIASVPVDPNGKARHVGQFTEVREDIGVNRSPGGDEAEPDTQWATQRTTGLVEREATPELKERYLELANAGEVLPPVRKGKIVLDPQGDPVLGVFGRPTLTGETKAVKDGQGGFTLDWKPGEDMSTYRRRGDDHGKHNRQMNIEMAYGYTGDALDDAGMKKAQLAIMTATHEFLNSEKVEQVDQWNDVIESWKWLGTTYSDNIVDIKNPKGRTSRSRGISVELMSALDTKVHQASQSNPNLNPWTDERVTLFKNLQDAQFSMSDNRYRVERARVVFDKRMERYGGYRWNEFQQKISGNEYMDVYKYYFGHKLFINNPLFWFAHKIPSEIGRNFFRTVQIGTAVKRTAAWGMEKDHKFRRPIGYVARAAAFAGKSTAIASGLAVPGLIYGPILHIGEETYELVTGNESNLDLGSRWMQYSLGTATMVGNLGLKTVTLGHFGNVKAPWNYYKFMESGLLGDRAEDHNENKTGLPAGKQSMLSALLISDLYAKEVPGTPDDVVQRATVRMFAQGVDPLVKQNRDQALIDAKTEIEVRDKNRRDKQQRQDRIDIAKKGFEADGLDSSLKEVIAAEQLLADNPNAVPDNKTDRDSALKLAQSAEGEAALNPQEREYKTELEDPTGAEKDAIEENSKKFLANFTSAQLKADGNVTDAALLERATMLAADESIDVRDPKQKTKLIDKARESLKTEKEDALHKEKSEKVIALYRDADKLDTDNAAVRVAASYLISMGKENPDESLRKQALQLATIVTNVGAPEQGSAKPPEVDNTETPAARDGTATGAGAETPTAGAGTGAAAPKKTGGGAQGGVAAPIAGKFKISAAPTADDNNAAGAGTGDGGKTVETKTTNQDPGVTGDWKKDAANGIKGAWNGYKDLTKLPDDQGTPSATDTVVSSLSSAVVGGVTAGAGVISNVFNRMKSNEGGVRALSVGGGVLGGLMAAILSKKVLDSSWLLGIGKWPVVGKLLTIGIFILGFMGFRKVSYGLLQGDGKHVDVSQADASDQPKPNLDQQTPAPQDGAAAQAAADLKKKEDEAKAAEATKTNTPVKNEGTDDKDGTDDQTGSGDTGDTGGQRNRETADVRNQFSENLGVDAQASADETLDDDASMDFVTRQGQKGGLPEKSLLVRSGKTVAMTPLASLRPEWVRQTAVNTDKGHAGLDMLGNDQVSAGSKDIIYLPDVITTRSAAQLAALDITSTEHDKPGQDAVKFDIGHLVNGRKPAPTMNPGVNPHV